MPEDPLAAVSFPLTTVVGAPDTFLNPGARYGGTREAGVGRSRWLPPGSRRGPQLDRPGASKRGFLLPHSALGPGVPDPPKEYVLVPKPEPRHRLLAGAFVLVKSVLGGLHHEYSLTTVPAKAWAVVGEPAQNCTIGIIAGRRFP